MPGCSGIKAANQLIQLENREIVLDYLGEPIVITRVFKSGRERERQKQGSGDIMREGLHTISGFPDGERETSLPRDAGSL